MPLRAGVRICPCSTALLSCCLSFSNYDGRSSVRLSVGAIIGRCDCRSVRLSVGAIVSQRHCVLDMIAPMSRKRIEGFLPLGKEIIPFRKQGFIKMT